jgi:hypothetical protein
MNLNLKIREACDSVRGLSIVCYIIMPMNNPILGNQVLLSHSSMNLKLFVFFLSISSLGKANPIGFARDDQAPLGYDLDLNSLRLVQLEGKDPVWMTEIEKVGFSILSSSKTDHWPATQIQVKAQGFKFFDM